VSVRLLLVSLLLVGIAVWLWALRGGGDGREDEILRAAPVLPDPDEAQRIEYFFRLFTSGAATYVGDRGVPTGRAVGEQALRHLGKEALDHLLAPARFDDYRASPHRLSALLRALPRLDAARGHALLLPFLLHWLDPDRCPPREPGTAWDLIFRRQVFTALTHYPDARARGACIDELTRGSREDDLRREALYVLVAACAVEDLHALYEALPPNESEPELPLRRYLLSQIHIMAGAGQPEEMQAGAKRMRGRVEESLESTRPMERIGAAAVLLRLGDESMAGRLLDEFDRAMADGESLVAWSALQLLLQDRAPVGARERCLRYTGSAPASAEETFDFEAAMHLLAKGWSRDEGVRSRVYRYLREREELDLVPLPDLVAADRPQALEFLREEILGNSPARRFAAVRFASAHPVREAGAWILEVLRRTRDVRERGPLFAGLTRLRTPGTASMLLAELEGAADPGWRGVVASALLETGSDTGLEELLERLSDRDEAVLDAVFQRALGRGAEGVPEALVPGILGAVRDMPGEAGRIKAVLALRCRGRDDAPTREGLTDAYRREPSRRVATEIKTTLIELAHR
jgi:hypothetical protein